MLVEDGCLALRRRRGALVVARGARGGPDAQKVAALTERLRDIAAELRSLGLTPAEIGVALRRATRPGR
jgi:hypothetical protein